MQNEIYDEKNGLTYMLCGDYYLPELALTDIYRNTERQNIKYCCYKENLSSI